MKLKLRIRIIGLLLFSALSLQAQINKYQFKRNLNGLTTNWHSLEIPNEVFKNSKKGLEDLRIYGFKGKDTIEVPYILEQSIDQITERETPFNIINQSAKDNSYFYTFHSTDADIINQIKLSFTEGNFDWKLTLEGSNDNSQWFTILKNYRILAIKNNNTDYHFTDLNFPSAKFKFFRIAINANKQPELNAIKILKKDTLKGIYKDINSENYELINDIKNKQTLIQLRLANPSLLSYLKINTQSSLDYYRTLKIEYATDSIKTEKGIQYNYASLYEGIISSLEPTEFNFTSTLVDRLKITIVNNDNQPLSIQNIILKGPVYELIGRFDDPTLTYALYYGKKDANAPMYELKNFQNKIPIYLTTLKVGDEEKNSSYQTKEITKPLFEQKVWLWYLMALIIILLGFFAFKMLKS